MATDRKPAADKADDPGRSALDNGLFIIEAIIWIARNRTRGPSLSPKYGNCNYVYIPFRGWAKKDILQMIFDTLAVDVE